MTIKFHAGYWTIVCNGQPVLMFASRADAEAMLAS